MAKLTVHDGSKGGKVYLFHCPGCRSTHVFYVEVPGMPNWSFDGNMERPTFTPSLLCNHTVATQKRCHLFLREGQLIFLSDCAHDFAGRTVPLEDNGLGD